MNAATSKLTQEMQEAALKALEWRKANPPEQVNNSALPAGSPMYYYCKSCGHLADTLPEDWFIMPPRELCGECLGLKKMGLL